MKQLNLKLTGEQYLGDAVVLIDGKPTQFKKNNFGNVVVNHQTEKDKATLEIYKALDVGGVLWFVTQLFFFVIGIFGIFDIHSKRKHIGLVYKAEIDLKEESILVLKCNLPRENSRAFEIDTDLSVREESNAFYVDEKAKKTFRFLLVAKIILALAIVSGIVAVLVHSL